MQISLVVPVRNEEATLRALVNSIRQQTRSPDEVILVDGGSTDLTVDLAQELMAGDARFRLIEAGNATPGKGRNVGVSAARFDWIAFTDAGIRLEPTWLERLARVVELEPVVEVVYGNFEPINGSRFERYAALTYPPPKLQRPGGRMRGPFIASSLIHRKVWLAVGGFPDLRAAEDLIFMERVREHGFKTGWAPTATVWWQLQPSLYRTFKKFVLYSRHNVWAGRQRDWHYAVALKYLAGLFFTGLAILHSFWWLAIPLLGALARVVKSIWRHREGRGLSWLCDPLQFFGVAIIILTIDVATFVGWAQAVWQRPEERAAQSTRPTVTKP